MNLHEQIEHDLLNRIQAGEWPVGARLPPEQEFAASLGVSRATLRAAYAQLEQQGILHRRKRAGTTVVSSTPQPVFRQHTSGLHSVLELSDSTRLKILSHEDVSDNEIPHPTGHTSATGYWLAITGARYLPDAALPFAWSTMYVTGEYAGIRPLLDSQPHAIYSLIEKTFSVTVSRLRQTVSATQCPEAAAPILGLEADATCLHILAELLSEDDKVVEITSTYFHPDKFHVKSDVSIVG